MFDDVNMARKTRSLWSQTTDDWFSSGPSWQDLVGGCGNFSPLRVIRWLNPFEQLEQFWVFITESRDTNYNWERNDAMNIDNGQISSCRRKECTDENWDKIIPISLYSVHSASAAEYCLDHKHHCDRKQALHVCIISNVSFKYFWKARAEVSFCPPTWELGHISTFQALPAPPPPSQNFWLIAKPARPTCWAAAIFKFWWPISQDLFSPTLEFFLVVCPNEVDFLKWFFLVVCPDPVRFFSLFFRKTLVLWENILKHYNSMLQFRDRLLNALNKLFMICILMMLKICEGTCDTIETLPHL